MAKTSEIEIVNSVPVPVYNDGQVQSQATDRQGNHLKLSPGIRCWYYNPESLDPEILKHYVSFRDDGQIDYIQIFDPEGDPLKFPELVGLPKQELWIKYKYCQRLDSVPQPPAPPEPPAPPKPEPFPKSIRITGVHWDRGLVLDIEKIE